MSGGLITALLFASLIVCLVTGIPIAFVLGGVALIFAYFLEGSDFLFIIATTTYGRMTNMILIALPMFIFMGNMLQISGIADDLYEMMHRWLGFLRGGLASGTVVICTIFAAMSGVSAAATVTMGLLALPAMLKRGYNKSIALGSIMAGGALGTLIPPSIVLIVIAMMLQVSVGKIFIAGILPGLLLSSFFIIYISIRCALQPHLGPGIPPEERPSLKLKFVSLRAIILPAVLIVTVLGSIFMGVATPTEASALGALGSIVVAAIHRRLTWSALLETCYRSLRVTCMCMWILIGGVTFSSIYHAVGGAEFVDQVLTTLPIGKWGILISMQLILFILGCLIDIIGICMITLPIFSPIIVSLGFDPLWFGIVFMVNMEMAYLTPPFGHNLFYLKGVAPKEVTMGDIYRSVSPFVALQAIGLAIVILFPQLSLWLPSLMRR
ncbi:TRAP transporter large permease subunit [Chloroflexota bacterium]